jgi:peptidoglycan hydrolase-like protein with peptidoglycan-binding domain
MDTLRRGDEGQQVKVLQKLLGGLTVDGIFGGNTETAVKEYQTAKGLTADGICGPLTWDALLGD